MAVFKVDNKHFDFFGSEDATTCHVALLRDLGQKCFFLDFFLPPPPPLIPNFHVKRLNSKEKIKKERRKNQTFSLKKSPAEQQHDICTSISTIASIFLSFYRIGKIIRPKKDKIIYMHKFFIPKVQFSNFHAVKILL